MTGREVMKTMRLGTRVYTPYILIYVRKNISNKPSKIACVVGKKISLSAVARHHYQRWMRESARSLNKNMLSGNDWVWIAKPSILKVKNLHDLINSLKPYLAELEKKLNPGERAAQYKK